MAYVPRSKMTQAERDAQAAAMAASAAAAKGRAQGTAVAAPQQQQQQQQQQPPAPYQSPPHNDFLQEPYTRKRPTNQLTWNPILKAYAENTSIAEQTRFDKLQSYKTVHETRKPAATNANNVKLNWDKKAISLKNRFADLLESVYLTTHPKISLRKAGCVIVFADSKALYTVNTEGALGFPKGDIEFTLADPKLVGSVGRETPEQAALRELLEETGFYPSSAPSGVGVAFQPFAGTLHRKVGSTVDPVSYTLEGVRSHTSGEQYYLIFFVKESSTDPRPDLSKRTPNAIKEKITGYAIEEQYAPGSKLSYNSFSRIAFTKTLPGGGKRKTRKQLKRKRQRRTRVRR